MSPRIFVTGILGQVARSLAERGPLQGLEVVTAGRPRCDLLDPASIEAALRATPSGVVVNAAAYTDVDQAELEPDLAMRVNRDGAAHVARAAAARGMPIIHLSTNYVFDGALERPYREDDRTGPLNAYGRSKLAGEIAVLACNPDHVILRTGWIFSPFGRNFLKSMLRQAETRPEVAVVGDQFGTPTSALDLADAIAMLALKLMARSHPSEFVGTFNMVAKGEASWAEFAEAVFAAAAEQGGKAARVNRVATADYPTLARRPVNSRLDTHKLSNVCGLTLPDWRGAVDHCVARLAPPPSCNQ